MATKATPSADLSADVPTAGASLATAPAAKAEKAPPTGAEAETQYALKRGTLDFSAPGYLGGVRITLTRGEPVPAEIWPHVAESDRDLFDTYQAPTA